MSTRYCFVALAQTFDGDHAAAANVEDIFEGIGQPLVHDNTDRQRGVGAHRRILVRTQNEIRGPRARSEISRKTWSRGETTAGADIPARTAAGDRASCKPWWPDQTKTTSLCAQHLRQEGDYPSPPPLHIERQFDYPVLRPESFGEHDLPEQNSAAVSGHDRDAGDVISC
jgi:hypothetical protein